jgi:hypothetical protein
MLVDASHPTYAVMALMAVKSIKSFSKGASRPAIKAYVEANNKVGKADNLALRAALTKLVASSAVTQDGQRFLLSKVAREAVDKKKAAPTKEKASTKKESTNEKASIEKELTAMEVETAEIKCTCSIWLHPMRRKL